MKCEEKLKEEIDLLKGISSQINYIESTMVYILYECENKSMKEFIEIKNLILETENKLKNELSKLRGE